MATLRRAIPGLTGTSVPLSRDQHDGTLGAGTGPGVSGFSYADLEHAVSPARAGRYLKSTTDPATGTADPDRAVALYEFNSELSASAWSTVADVEVVLRNALADAIGNSARDMPNEFVESLVRRALVVPHRSMVHRQDPQDDQAGDEAGQRSRAGRSVTPWRGTGDR